MESIMTTMKLILVELYSFLIVNKNVAFSFGFNISFFLFIEPGGLVIFLSGIIFQSNRRTTTETIIICNFSFITC